MSKLPITVDNVWDVIKRANQKRFMSHPFFLIMNCEYEDAGDEVLIYWRWTENTLIYPTRNPKYLANRNVWCLKDDLTRLKNAGLEIKKAPGDTTEYFYKTRDLAQLAGKDFKKIRNKVHKFETAYKHQIRESCDPALLKEFVTTWFNTNKTKKTGYFLETIKFEFESTLEMINLLPSLPQVRQMYVFVDNKLAGMAFYCPLYDDFWVSITQKTDYAYDGLAKFMYHEKCKRMITFPIASFGDDATDPALAASKLELRPYRTEIAYMAETGDYKPTT